MYLIFKMRNRFIKAFKSTHNLSPRKLEAQDWKTSEKQIHPQTLVIHLYRYQFDRLPSPRANPGPLIFFVAPGTAFQCKTPVPGSKNETKSPPSGIICLVRMLRYQWKRNIILSGQFLSKFSIIVCLTIFFYRENKVFASLYTTVKINTAIMQ